MCTYDQIRNELSRSWMQVNEGWRSLSLQLNQALTQFKPILRYGIPQQHAGVPCQGLLPVELHEQGEVISLRMEAPGIEQQSLEIQGHGSKLVISGEKRMAHLREDGHYHMLECAYGQFRREVPLPCGVDLEHSTALYQNGVLIITLPKMKTNTQRIEVLFQ